MKWKFGKVPDWVLILLTGISIVFFIALEKSRSERRSPYYEEKLAAAELNERAMLFLKEKRLELGITIDPFNDPNATGLIGHPFSLITTRSGDIVSKWTSLNPNFAALVVKHLKKLQVREGDTVAVQLTGSFPALNTAVLSAIKTLNLRPIIISSLGSSSFGANDPRWTWLDMERALNEGGIFPWRSIRASLGGEDDMARGLSQEGKKLLEDAIKRNGIPYLNPRDLEESVKERLKLYKSEGGKSVKVFINVGAGAASLGPLIRETKEVPSGILERRDVLQFPPCLIREMLGAGIPVINYVNIQEMAKKEGLPVAPMPLPPPGEGRLFVTEKYSVTLASVLSLVLAFLLFFVIRFDLTEFLSQGRS